MKPAPCRSILLLGFHANFKSYDRHLAAMDLAVLFTELAEKIMREKH